MRSYLHKSFVVTCIAAVSAIVWFGFFIVPQAIQTLSKPRIEVWQPEKRLDLPALQEELATLSAERSLSDEIERRPLFASSRLPFVAAVPTPVVVEAPAVVQTPLPPPQEVPAPVVEVAPQTPADAIVLKGIVGDARNKEGLLAINGSNEVKWYKTGDTLQGWTIIVIGDDNVVLQNASAIVKIKQYVDNPSTTLAPGQIQQ
jgi:hypothetical protein